MSRIAVSISLPESLLAEIDVEAQREGRSRSALLREAARQYVRRQRQWHNAFALGDARTAVRKLTEVDVKRQLRFVRKRGRNPRR